MDTLCQYPVVLKKNVKMWKVYDIDNNNNNESDNNNSDNVQRTQFNQKSSIEPSDQES